MSTFEFRFHVTGSDRKRLVTAIAEITECAAKYKGAPTFAYEVDYFTIDKNGTVSFDDRADSEEIENLIERLHEQGFDPELRFEDLRMTEEEELGLGRQHRDPVGEDGMQPSDVPDDDELVDSLVLSYPRKDISDAALENLRQLVASKDTLIKKALTVDALPIEVDDEKVSFPWFDGFRRRRNSALTRISQASSSAWRKRKSALPPRQRKPTTTSTHSAASCSGSASSAMSTKWHGRYC